MPQKCTPQVGHHDLHDRGLGACPTKAGTKHKRRTGTQKAQKENLLCPLWLRFVPFVYLPPISRYQNWSRSANWIWRSRFAVSRMTPAEPAISLPEKTISSGYLKFA